MSDTLIHYTLVGSLHDPNMLPYIICNKNSVSSDKGEFIEMTTMNHMNQSQESSLTPPVRCSSRNSVANAVSGLSPIQMEKASDRKCQDGESVSEENDHKDTTGWKDYHQLLPI